MIKFWTWFSFRVVFPVISDAKSRAVVYVWVHLEGNSKQGNTVKMMCGGTSEAKPADAEIQAIINEVMKYWSMLVFNNVSFYFL